VSRDIDRAQALGEASEHDLLIALGDMWGAREARHMTRSAWIEAHHQMLYAIGRLNDLKVHLEARDYADIDWRHVVLEAVEVQTMMSALCEYVTTGKGGTSYLGDRNTR
jgi:hypothetical protein